MDRQKEDSYQIVNYYKRNRTIDMLLMEEFAFSLLFNNIAPDKLQVALDSVGLNRIPSLFLLIQVDDHLNESKRLNTENEFVLKVRIADIIRTCFERNGLEPVVANLTGTDKLVAFLVMDESVERDNLIVRISNEICEKVNIFAGYSVSICASDPCKNLEDCLDMASFVYWNFDFMPAAMFALPETVLPIIINFTDCIRDYP